MKIACKLRCDCNLCYETRQFLHFLFNNENGGYACRNNNYFAILRFFKNPLVLKTADKIKDILTEAADSVASLIKVALMSRPASASSDSGRGTLIVMGNGPSLRDAIDNNSNVLRKYPLLSVNFAPNTPEFFALKPEIHVLADGVFFAPEGNENVASMWKALKRVEWQMTLYVPATQKKIVKIQNLPSNVIIKYFNLTPASGWKWLTRILYSSGLAMPRPRNVLIPAIMSGIREGYKKILLIGADHSWSKTLWVTDHNLVMSVQPHFYKDNEKERQRVESVYKDIRLHQIYESFAIAFRSYFAVRDYAEAKGVEILNATPESFIDAFDRIDLKDTK